MPSDDHRLPMTKSLGLVDVLDRILDKGLVVAGDIKISLADVELLTVRIRLIICSVDKAEKIGMDWWRTDPYFSSMGARTAALGTTGPAAGLLPAPAAAEETRRLEARMTDIDQKLAALLQAQQRQQQQQPSQKPGPPAGEAGWGGGQSPEQQQTGNPG